MIVTGLPATGKTTVAKRISEEFGIPLYSKDLFKESLFDSLGYSDRDWSKRLGAAAYEILFAVVEAEVSAGRSVIAESNFGPDSTLRFLDMKVRFVQVLCHARGDLVFERFADRAWRGDRHPGHVDADNVEEFKSELHRGRIDPLELSGPVIEVDTTDFDAIDFVAIHDQLKSQLELK